MDRQIFAIFLLCWASIFVQAQVFSWKNPNIPRDSTKIDSILVEKLNKDYYTKDTLDFIKKSPQLVYDEEVLVRNTKSRILGDLNSKGSIVRGITFGNNQGSSVQSSMDLQISGKLSDDVSILASVSDHNLPIQADGYTQTLQEFDKIFVQLDIKKHTIIRAGHLDLDNNKTFFGRYQRRSMGLQFLTKWQHNGNTTDFDVSAGVARSEFNRMRFQGIEGNQGPYRLLGKNGEAFITIISGSEQVFIDGVVMKRGESLDYTINYNTGEITFTSFRPIYKQNFITITYNYTNRNYTRFLVTGNLQHQRDRLRLGLSWFIENDNKNAPLSLNLTDEDKQYLINAGNNADMMFAPSGIKTDYDVNKILYKKVYTGAIYHYEFSNSKEDELYQVSFTYFGEQKGDYRVSQSTNNGRMFEYVGLGLGDYLAVRRLPAPEKTQVFSTNAEYALEDGVIGIDASFSNRDLNLYSSKDNNENIGYATRLYANKTFTKNNWKATPTLELQHIQKNFRVLDRINNVEFSRDFNLTEEFNHITQNRIVFGVDNLWKDKTFLNYKLNYLDEKDFYRGLKNDFSFGWQNKRWITLANASYLETKSTEINTQFIRANTSAELLGKKGSWTVGGAMEHNLKKYNTTQLYDNTSFSWKEVFLQKKITDSTNTKFLTKLYFRNNDSVRDNRLQKVNHILGIMAESQIIKTEKTQWSALLHYRKFFYADPLLANNQNQDFVVGNMMYNQQLFRNGMRLQAFYELGNGQEAQREFQYIKVTDGQGIYKWTDYNGDGIQQLDEFEIAEFIDQAQYIRVYTNTVKYLASNKNKLQLALFVNPSVILSSENEFLKRWNFNISLLSQNAFTKGSRVVVLNPFAKEKDQIMKTQNIMFSALFNSNDKSGWNGNYRFSANDNLLNANYSVEERSQDSHFLNIGYGFNKNFRTDWENQLQNISNNSQIFTSRDYQLTNWESKPKATYRLTESLQAELFGALRQKKRTDGEERLKAYELSGTLQWDYKKTSLRGNFSFIKNTFIGNSFSIVGNQMLEGLKDGKNQVWNIILQQSINSFLQLNLNYEGRNSGDRTIHTGSMQLRASF